MYAAPTQTVRPICLRNIWVLWNPAEVRKWSGITIVAAGLRLRLQVPENVGYTWDVVVSKTATTIYVNGVRQSSENSSYGLAGILGNSGILQIGKANWGSGEYYKGWIDNFRIENRALGEEEVKVLASEFVDKLPLEITEVVTGSAPDRGDCFGISRNR